MTDARATGGASASASASAGAGAGAGRRITTGLLGGSFNPAHGGHRAITLRAMRAGRLDTMWWLVSPANPLKPVAGMAPLPARLASARRLARRTPVRVTAIEARLGTRYTADTLRALMRRFPRRSFVWVMGADNLAQFHRWRDWRRIALSLPIIVVARPGHDAAARLSVAAGWMRAHRPGAIAAARARAPGDAMNGPLPRVLIVTGSRDERSATALRAADPRWADRLATGTVRDPLAGGPAAFDVRRASASVQRT